MADTNTMHTLNTRIKLKYDSYQNWYDKNPVLLEGEVAIAAIESNENNITTTGFANLPNIAVKVGNGTAAYRDLKFISALAGDVHEWAKKNVDDFHNDMREWLHGDTAHSQWLKGFIGDEIQDTDTRYTLLVEESAPWIIKLMATDPAKSDTTYDIEVARIDLTTLDTRIKAVEEALGEGGSVDTRIQSAIDGLTLADPLSAGTGKVFDTISQTNGVISATTRDLAVADVAGLQDALDGLNTGKQDKLDIDGTPSADNKVLTQESLSQLAYPDANAEEGKFVTKVTETNGVIAVERRALKAEDIPALTMDKVTGLDTALAGKQEKLVIDGVVTEENPVATKKTVTDAVAGLEGAMHFRGRVTGDTLEAAIAASDISDWANGDVVLWGDYEYVWDGANWLELGNTGLYQLSADAKTQHDALTEAINDGLALKQDKLDIDGTPSAENPVMTKEAVTGEITGNNEALTYNGGDAGANKFVTKVTQTKGVVAAEYAQPQMGDIAGLNAEIQRIDKAIEDGLAEKQDELDIDGTPSAENKVATQETVQGAIDALNYTDTDVVEGQFITAISEEKGVLKNIARGNVTTDMIHQGALTLVFDCGNATI